MAKAFFCRIWATHLGYQSDYICEKKKIACDIIHNPVQHDYIKHVEIDKFFIKEKLDEKL